MKNSENNKDLSKIPQSSSSPANNCQNDSISKTTIPGCGPSIIPSSTTMPPTSSPAAPSAIPAETTSTPSSSSSVASPACVPINLNIATTTGGNFSVLVDIQNSVENLKKIIAKKLKVAKDRICLLHRERELQDGNLKENGLVEGSKIILIPNVETGLLAQRPENTVMQALESLNDTQVNDFLSGKTPLNLSMRLGDHMMLIQLQLSTISPTNSPNNRSRPRSRSGRINTPVIASTSTNITSSPSSFLFNNTSCVSSTNDNHLQETTSHTRNFEQKQQTISQSISTSHQNVTVIQQNNTEFYPSNTIAQQPQQKSLPTVVSNCCATTSAVLNNSYENTTSSVITDQSPIKSLSNLVSNPLKSAPIKNVPSTNSSSSNSSSSNNSSSSTSSCIEDESMCSDPISAKLTSCLCKRLDGTNTNMNGCETNQCQQQLSKHDELHLVDTDTAPIITNNIPEVVSISEQHQHAIKTAVPSIISQFKASNPSSFSSQLLHKTLNNTISKHKYRPQQHHHQHPSTNSTPICSSLLKRNLIAYDRKQQQQGTSSINTTTTTTTTAATKSSYDAVDGPGRNLISTPTNNRNCSSSTNTEIIIEDATKATTISATDARALAEASRNLTQTLRKLSKEVFTNKINLSDPTPRKCNSGAVIESMKNHGKGIYSGTFSGTLNPALQDQYGRPKRDISTVIHILNDLLSATPQYNRDTGKISFEPSLPAVTSQQSTPASSASVGRLLKSTKYNFSTPNHHHQECKKCLKTSSTTSSLTTAATCAYGECNGHVSSVIDSSFPPSGSLNNSNNRHFHQQPPHHDHHYSLPYSSSCYQQDSSLSSVNNDNNRISSVDLNLSSLSSSSSSMDERNLCCSCNNGIVGDGRSMNRQNSIESSAGSDDSITTSSMCNKCSIELENSKTKCKLDHLRLVMQQKKQKREARKLKGTPYAGSRLLNTQQSNNIQNDGITDGNENDAINGSSGENSDQSSAAVASATTNTITPIASPSEVSPNHIVEEVDTAA